MKKLHIPLNLKLKITIFRFCFAFSKRLIVEGVINRTALKKILLLILYIL